MTQERIDRLSQYIHDNKLYGYTHSILQAPRVPYHHISTDNLVPKELFIQIAKEHLGLIVEFLFYADSSTFYKIVGEDLPENLVPLNILVFIAPERERRECLVLGKWW